MFVLLIITKETRKSVNVSIQDHMISFHCDPDHTSLARLPTLPASPHSSTESPILHRELRVRIPRNIHQVGQRADLAMGRQNTAAVLN